MKWRSDHWLMTGASVLSIVALIVLLRDLTPAEGSPEAVSAEVARLIRDNALVQRDDKDLAVAAANGMASSLDRYSAAWDPDEYAAESERNAGHFAGIGVLLGETRLGLTVLQVLPGGPAEKAGLLPLDVISVLEGTQVPAERALDFVRGKLRGVLGSVSTLHIARGLETLEFRIERGPVDAPSAYGALVDAQRGLAVLVIDAFHSNTPDQVLSTLRRLKDEGMKALVLDLRDNPGGVLRASTEIAALFIGKEKVLVRTIGRQGEIVIKADRAAEFADLPLVTLMDQRTASASEVLAAALQDYARSPLLGERSYGKGVVQHIEPLRSLPGAGVRLTTAHHFAPSGRCIENSVGLAETNGHRGGLIPDVAWPVAAAERQTSDALRLTWQYPSAVRDIMPEAQLAGDRALQMGFALLCGAAPPDRNF